MSNTRARRPAGNSDCVAARREGGTDSIFAARAKANPQAMLRMPGNTKAIRHPKYFTMNPVTMAEQATPRLPANPLTPMVHPGRGEPCTSMGIPTG